MTWDVIVVGVGGMGSAACWQLARRGQRVLGLERFDIPHAMGSSHGISRIIRLPYYEDPAYVPLLRPRLRRCGPRPSGERARRCWSPPAPWMAGPEDDALFRAPWPRARLHDLPHEVLTGAAVNERFPGYRMAAAAASWCSRRAG